MVEAVVEYDYVAQQPDELSLKKGDVISDIRTQPGGWWEGSLDGKRGMFPDNFVKVRSELTNSSSDVTLRSTTGRRCKVLFSYQPVNEDELQLKVNDVINVIAEVEEGWWKGKLGDTVGVFPSNFVTEITDGTKPRTTSREEASESDGEVSASMSSPDSSQLLDSVSRPDQDTDVPVLPPKPVKELCRALFPYEAENEDELTLKKGDVIILLSKEVQDKGWWRGELRGKVGVFPDNFVEIVQHDEQPKKPERPPTKSQLVTTNKGRDSITKPAASGVSKGDAGDISQRKGIETSSKTEEKSPTMPPVPGKKPVLPPPIKKPQRIGHINVETAPTYTKREMGITKSSDQMDGAGTSRLGRGSLDSTKTNTESKNSLTRKIKEETPDSENVDKCAMIRTTGVLPSSGSNRDEVLEFDSVERSAMLTHPTASRVKAPRRRPPTLYKDSDVSSGLMNGNAETGHPEGRTLGQTARQDPPLENHQEEDEDEEREMGSGRGRLWDKNKAPWVEELKLNQAKKTSLSPTSRTSPSPVSPTLLSQSIAAGGGKSPEQQGEKRGIIPSLRTKPEAGRIRAGILGSLVTAEEGVAGHAASDPVPVASKQANTRHHKPRPQSMYSDFTRTSLSMVSPPHTDQSRLVSDLNKNISSSIRSSNLSSSPVFSNILSNSQTSKPDSNSLSSLSDPDLISPASAAASPGTTVTYKQYMELKDKVSKLERILEQQREEFEKALTELTSKLTDEAEKRLQIQQELDKLTNLVTQV